jgi:hypothetical protein
MREMPRNYGAWMGTRYRSQSNGAKRVGRGEARAARVFSRQELEVTAEHPCYRISMRELRVPGVLCAACLTNVAADKHFIEAASPQS